MGEPVYKILDWNSIIGFIVPVLLLAYVTVIFILLEWLSAKKLIRNEMEHIVDILKGKVGSK